MRPCSPLRRLVHALVHRLGWQRCLLVEYSDLATQVHCLGLLCETCGEIVRYAVVGQRREGR
jgi:hypothetical protein